MNYVLCDIDGCVLNLEHRLESIMKGDFESFHENDTIIPQGYLIYNALLADRRLSVVFNTSRPESNRATTEKQLRAIFGKKRWQLWMRQPGPRLPDQELKINQVISRSIPFSDIFMVFDDRNVICEAFRAHGVVAYQTATGY